MEIEVDFNMKRDLIKKIILGIIVLLVLEVSVLGIVYFSQPSYEQNIISVIDGFKSPDGLFYETASKNELSIESTYSALSISAILNKSELYAKPSLLTFIKSTYDNQTNLFMDEGKPSLEATYSAVGSLSILGKLYDYNTTAIRQAILSLQTPDFLFKESNDSSAVTQNVGELDHLFEAISSLDKLYDNLSQYYNDLNRSAIGIALLTLQQDGGFKENIFQNLPNMRNAYHATGIMSKLGPNLAFYESLSFNSLGLKQWIESMYTEQGFKLHSSSQPSVEATAYAILSLDRLGLPADEIYSRFHEGIESMVNFLDENLFIDESHNALDIIHDILFAMKRINYLDKIQRPYMAFSNQLLFGAIIGLTFLFFIGATALNIITMLKENDQDYYESALRDCLKTAVETQGSDLSELSYLLGEEIDQIVIVYPEDEAIANLRAISDTHEFIVYFETFSWLPKKLLKYVKNTTHPIVTFDFLETKDLFYTVDQGIAHLKDV